MLAGTLLGAGSREGEGKGSPLCFPLPFSFVHLISRINLSGSTLSPLEDHWIGKFSFTLVPQEFKHYCFIRVLKLGHCEEILKESNLKEGRLCNLIVCRAWPIAACLALHTGTGHHGR